MKVMINTRAFYGVMADVIQAEHSSGIVEVRLKTNGRTEFVHAKYLSSSDPDTAEWLRGILEDLS